MKTNEIQFDRLLQFANYLLTQPDPDKIIICPVALAHVENGNSITVNANMLAWVFNYLPGAFGYLLNDCLPFCPVGEDGVDTRLITSVYDFFGLENVADYVRLFAVNNNLNEKSGCKEVAKNIIAFIKEKDLKKA